MAEQITNLDERRPKWKRCYLVAHIDTSATPPAILGTGLYGEPAGSLTGAMGIGRFAFDVCFADGHDYESARRAVLNSPRPWRAVYQWAIDMLPAEERGT